MAETLDEEQFCLELFGVRPVEYLEQVGWLGDDVWLAHCVHLDEREVRRFGETGTGVAHCPSSNARLGAGIAPVAALTAAGAPVGLGVDGAASNEAGELAGELREALLVARIKGGPQALTAREALALGTIHGARCLGREDEIGSLEPGKLADVALWQVGDLDHAGIADPVAALVLGRAPDRRHAAGRRPADRRERPPHHGRRGGDRPRHRQGEPPDAGGGRVTVETSIRGGIGESLRRPDGIPKVKGDFAYSSDLWADGMLWGSTLRSPHPRARIREINIAPALAIRGVFAVLTHEDVPGRKVYGLEIPDQPVLAFDQVRYQGEAVAIVAADHPETARHAASKIEVDYEVLEPVTDPEKAFDAEPLHPSGNLLRHVRIEHGDPSATAEVVVSGEYEVGMQDQAFLGPESGLAVPAEDGGVDLFVSTQWLHVDRDQTAASLDLPPEKVRITLGGVGGAFGGREDLSMQIHACLLALHTGKPVKMMYGREESFFGHIHRHPARMRYEHGATRDGDLVYVKCRILLDGGAYASSSTAVCSNAACFAVGPYEVPNALIDSYVVYTDNPPCGAMRGFGAVQTCFAHEAQMDKLAAALGMDPVELRRRNAAIGGHDHPHRRADHLARAGRRAARQRRPRGRCRGRARSCPAATPTPPTARACGAASATRSATRTSATPRASTTTRPRACGSRWWAASRWWRSTPRPPRSARAS